MASTALSIQTVTLASTGLTIVPKTIVTAETITISATTAQGAIDFNTLMIRVTANTTSTTVISLAAGTQYSSIGQGAYTVNIPSATSVIIGGTDFEGARFQNSSGSLVFTQTSGTGASSWEAFQMPKPSED